jgi:lysophospholipase L1-like esterase
MKLIARLISAALAVASLGTTPAFAGDGGPLAAWHNAHTNADTAQANIVWLGSSTTYGVGASTPDKRYTNLVTNALGGGPVTHVGDTYPTRNTTAGVHGYVSAPGGSNSENYITDANRPWILWERPSLIVHMVGSNDSVDREPFAVPVNEYEANIGAQIDRLDAATSRPMSHLLIHTYRRFDVTAEKWKTYGDALARVAAARDNVAVLDVSQEYENADHVNGDPRDLISEDALHPSDAGHALMAALIAPMLGAELPAPVEPEPTTPAPVAVEAAPPATPAAATPVVEASEPAAPSRVRAVRNGKRAKVIWRKAADADAYAVRCGNQAKTVNGSRALVRSTAKRCSVRSINDAGTSPTVRVRVKRR